jgi:spore coat polysaccharide biosynthesis protein SpsF
MRILAIIQARTKSTRLPNKILKDIAGKPMLWHVINRLKFSNYIGKIILSIPDNKDNDVLENFARENRALFYRGSENDVLSRYYGTAVQYNADVIVRITSDCPLIDPEITDLAIERHLNSDADYTYADTRSGFPRGLDTEVFEYEALENAHVLSTKDYEREHVTPFIYEHPDLFKLQNVKAEGDLISPLRLTVDTEEDLELMREIYKRLYFGKIFSIIEVIDLFKAHPELAKINAEIKQKALH